ncbi:MAG TPA: non-reducing end alpha-L-arabinofuranosidase family hydrolase, partial [Bacteroidales bacterium]
QVFWFGAKGKWFLIYQSGLGASFSTNTDVGSPSGWTANRAMGFTDGIDFWCISDGTNVYCFYSAQDGSHTIKRRSTTVSDFPYNWSSPTVAATNTFEAPHVYRNKADGKYYMMVEDLGRYFELWTATSLGGTWTQVAEKWAAKSNLTETAEHWTDQVSHGEILRSGTDEFLEITNINHCDILIQGVVNGSYEDYGSIPYNLGLIHNY